MVFLTGNSSGTLPQRVNNCYRIKMFHMRMYSSWVRDLQLRPTVTGFSGLPLMMRWATWTTTLDTLWLPSRGTESFHYGWQPRPACREGCIFEVFPEETGSRLGGG